jgi:hypothetical protein
MTYKDKKARKKQNQRWREKHPNADKIRYKNNPEYFKENNRRNRQKKVDYVWNYKINHPCIICGESAPECLDFHHRNSEEKYKNIADMLRDSNSIEKIDIEINKCDILCANCHRKSHYLENSR